MESSSVLPVTIKPVLSTNPPFPLLAVLSQASLVKKMVVPALIVVKGTKLIWLSPLPKRPVKAILPGTRPPIGVFVMVAVGVIVGVEVLVGVSVAVFVKV